MGLEDIDVIIGHKPSSQGQQKKASSSAEHKKAGIVSDIVTANRKALKELQEKEEAAGGDMLDGLEEITEEQAEVPPPQESADSDFAPVSPYADMPTKEEEAKLAEEKRK